MTAVSACTNDCTERPAWPDDDDDEEDEEEAEERSSASRRSEKRLGHSSGGANNRRHAEVSDRLCARVFGFEFGLKKSTKSKTKH